MASRLVFYLVQAGTNIYVVSELGTVYQVLTMPAGVTIDGTRRARFAVLTQKVIIANAPSVNVWVDPATFNVYKLAIAAPVSALSAAPNATPTSQFGLYKWRYTFAHTISGVVMNESPMSPEMAAGVTLSNVGASLSSIGVDSTVGTPTNMRRIYRTSAGGSEYFHAFDIADNVTTTATDNNSDASLDLVAFNEDIQNAQAGSDGTSHFSLLIEYQNALFGVPDILTATASLIDDLLYTDPKQMYAWSAFNDIEVPQKGNDRYGVTGLVKRRDGACVFKRDRCLKLTGETSEDFDLVVISEKLGCIAPDSVVVINDVTYWLGADGVYMWDDNDGITCVSRQQVDGWFTSDTYFDRTQFPNAVGNWNPVTNCYELSLVPIGGTDLTAWVAFELTQRKWFGPHQTAAFTPTGRVLLRSTSGIWRPMFGASDGYLYAQNQDGADDIDGTGVSHAVASDWSITPMFDGDPNVLHYWGEVHATFREETTGVTLTLVPTVGGLESSSSFTITIALSGQTRARLRRLGTGQLCVLRFTQNALGAKFLLYGLDIDPVSIVGRRT